MIRTGAQLCTLCNIRERAFVVTANQAVNATDVIVVRQSACPECAGSAEAGGVLIAGWPALIVDVTEIPIGVR